MSESAEQIALFAWADMVRLRHPELRWMFAIPNGAFRHRGTAGRLKAEGVKPGVWDVFLPVCRGGRAGLWIEMKAGRNTTTDLQNDFGTAMLRAGYACVVCHGWAAARDQILRYLNCPQPVVKLADPTER